MKTWFSISILLLWMLMAVVGPLLPLQPDEVDLSRKMQGPSAQALLGSDDLGRPLLHRLVYGAQTSFFVSFFVVGISVILGTFIGAVSGYFSGVIDLVITRIIDIFLAFPGILLVIALAGLLGPGIENVIIAMSCVGWVGFARLARAQTLSLVSRDHVQAAIALGSRPFTIILKHIIPLISAPLIVEATFGIAAVIIAEAGLSFLGLGVQPPSASWGSMIRDGTAYMLVSSHIVIVPGVTLMLVVLSVNLLGDRLRDWFDVRTRLKN